MTESAAARIDASAHPASDPPGNSPSGSAGSGPRRAGVWARRALRVPFTTLLVIVILTVAIATGSLLSPAADMPWFERIATGLPAFAEGRWFTVATSPFVLTPPVALLLIAPVLIGGVGWAEWRFGTLRTVGLFAAGHLVGVFGAAGVLLLVAPSGWPWAVRLSEALDVGPSAGAFACLAFVLATLPSPWRLRARFALGVWAGIEVLYMGQLANLEHAIAITAGLIASGWLPAFRHPAGRPSTREWRVLSFAGLLIIGLVQVIDLAIPYDGPLGQHFPVANALDVALDVIFIALIANGIRLGLRWAWIITIAVAIFNALGVALGIALIPLLLDEGIIASPIEALSLVLPEGLLWLVLLVVLIAARGAFRVPLRTRRRALAGAGLSRDAALERLRTVGGGTISWMIGWAPNRYLPVGDDPDSGAGSSGVVGYQAHAGVAIGLGDPVVAQGDQSVALAEFARASEQAGLIPCVFSAGREAAEARPAGWRAVIVAEDTIVDLPGLELTGKRWQPVRTSVNRAAREGIEFRMCQLADESFGVRAQVRAISEQWTGDKGLPEMRFTLGTVDEAMDPETRVGLAVDVDGNLHGITSWLPVYGGGGEIHGWTLDLMRRRDGGFGPVMEFLIASSALHFAEAGYRFVSLSGAPLVRPEDAEAGPVDRVLAGLGALIEPLYGFRSLHRFKQKFNPRAEPLHLLFRDEGDLPRIAVALTRAYLPDASLRDLVASASAASPASPASEGAGK
ncbi:bifunctional lysylphosphatidylglycerol flippase/synthetase MprF [Leucobacter sp. W1478]|uniref:bifunctional lysylphosphatidylglycerol flippase/synthetase MprF n=1 Tax=Leucobacter sp. W1478 TaxID=3439065 RepID=UPI003F3CB745